jgi:hypothetical protein
MTIFEKMENVNKAMNWLRSKGMNMRGYGPEDILDGNVNVISAIIWYNVAVLCVSCVVCVCVCGRVSRSHFSSPSSSSS